MNSISEKEIRNSSVNDCHLISLDIFKEDQGNMISIEGQKTVPFPINRVYYLYDIPEEGSRGAHAHEDLYQLIVATGGSFNMVLDDGQNKKTVHLNQPNYGLLVVPGIWRELVDFSHGAVCLVLASLTYEDNIVIRDYEEFKKFKHISG
jgi:hypothetical protein